MTRTEIRIALPSKGILAEDTLSLLSRAGLGVYKPNPRQYMATIPALPGLTVLFQRAGDIAVSVHDGTVDFGITGWDMVAEKSDNGDVLPMLPELGYGFCSLNVIVPEEWSQTRQMADLRTVQADLERPLRVATKFPKVTQAFFEQHGLTDVQFIPAEGTLEIAPTIGYTDFIVDLVSTGQTLRQNSLVEIEDVMDVTARLVVNPASMKIKADRLVPVIEAMRKITKHT